MPSLQHQVPFRENTQTTTYGLQYMRVCIHLWCPILEGRRLIPWVYDTRRLAEMEQEIEMVKATQQQMQTMFSEILNELRRAPGRPLQSASTESPTASSWNAGIVLPAAQTSSPGSMSGKRL